MLTLLLHNYGILSWNGNLIRKMVIQMADFDKIKSEVTRTLLNFKKQGGEHADKIPDPEKINWDDLQYDVKFMLDNYPLLRHLFYTIAALGPKEELVLMINFREDKAEVRTVEFKAFNQLPLKD